jgi:RIP metalloprotease RseP
MRSPDPVVTTADEVAPDAEASTPVSWVGLAILVGVMGAVGVLYPNVLLVIVAIAIIIFLHELGHYMAARHAGMKVTEFFLGIGPRIWSFRRGEVEYGVKAIPAAAYVRIIGMSNLDEVPPEDEARTYRQKPYRQRMLVAVAGSGMHFLLAIVLAFTVFLVWGQRDPEHWAVDTASPGSAAALAGIREGDRVVSVDGVPVDTHAEMSEEIRRRPGADIDLVVDRDGEQITVPVDLGARSFLYGTIGEDVSLAELGGVVSLNSIMADSAQDRAGLRDGDVVASLNGVQLDSLDDLDAATDASVDGQLAFVVDRSGEPTAIDVDLGKAVAASQPTGFLGVGQELVPHRLGPADAARESVVGFGETVGQAVGGIGKLFNPANLGELAGKVVTGETEPDQPDTPTSASDTDAKYVASQENRPVSIIGVVDIGSQLGTVDRLLMFLVGFNIIIGVINLIPLLPFDGGHVAVGTYERIREKLRGDGTRYFADVNKLMPVAIGMVMLMVTIGVLGASLDILDPIKI